MATPSPRHISAQRGCGFHVAGIGLRDKQHKPIRISAVADVGRRGEAELAVWVLGADLPFAVRWPERRVSIAPARRVSLRRYIRLYGLGSHGLQRWVHQSADGRRSSPKPTKARTTATAAIGPAAPTFFRRKVYVFATDAVSAGASA
jgi:hypothetical protein